MAFSIVLTDRAKADLRSIHAHLTLTDRALADRITNDLLEHAHILERLPFLGSVFEEDVERVIREIMCYHYRIFYRVDESKSQVALVCIQHAARRDPIF